MQQQVARNTQRSGLSDLRNTILKWLELEDPHVIDIIMATYAANNLSTDPLWVLIIGPPSHAKTELLRGLEGHLYQGIATTCMISNLTPSTLVSGIIPKKGRPEPSLVYRLNDKCVVLKDFTSILSMRSENQQEIIAQLREMYDGQYTKEFGNGKTVNWSGRFGLIGACTPVYDQHYGVVAQMGERFLLYRVQGTDDLSIGRRALAITGQEDEMREDIQSAMHSFMDGLHDLSSFALDMRDEFISETVVNLACIVARGRCPVSRDYRSGEVLYQPAPEGPPRITKQLTQLGMGLALVYGKSTIDSEILQSIRKVARDLMPAYRRLAIECLWNHDAVENSYISLTTSDVAEKTGMVVKTALRTMEDLMLTGVLHRTKPTSDAINAPYRWALTERAEELIRNGVLFEK